MASSGLTSFQVDIPHTGSNLDARTDDVLTLFSKTGPLQPDELAVFENLAQQSNPQSRLVAKLVETVQFQRMELSNLQKSAVEITGTMLHKQKCSFSELDREHATAMQLFLNQTRDERERFSILEGENRILKEKLSGLENLVEDIVEFCKQFRPEFSLAEGVRAAMEPLFANQKTRRQSADQAAQESRGMEEAVSRVLSLEALLKSSQARATGVENENASLRTQLQELEEMAIAGTSNSPEASPMLVRPRSSPERAEVAARTSQRINELETELALLREQVEAVSAEKAKVDDAILSLNVDLQEKCKQNGVLREQRNLAELETRRVEKERGSDRENYHNMEAALTQNVINAVADLDEKEGRIERLEKDIEERESVIKSLQKSAAELDRNLDNLTQEAIKSSQRSHEDSNSQYSPVDNVIDGVMKTLREELTHAKELLAGKSKDLAEFKKRVAHQDEKTFALRRECDRLRAMAASKSTVFGSSRETNLKQQQYVFLQRLSDTLGCRPGNSKDFVGKLIGRVEELVRERAGFESSAVKLRSEVLERERTLHLVRSEMQGEISALKAEVQHLQNVKNRVDEECKIAQGQVMELLQERDISDVGSIADITSSSVGTRRQSGFSFADTSRRESMYSMIGPDNTIHWKDPLVVAAIQSLDQLADLKDRLAARLRTLMERQDRMARNGESPAIGQATKALIIESNEILGDLSNVVDMKQHIFDQLAAPRTHDSVSVAREADDTLPYIVHGQVEKETLSQSTSRSVDRPTPLANVSNLAPSRRESFAESGNVGKEAASFLEIQLKRTRDMYNDKSRANAELCGVVAELQQQIDHILHEKRTTQELLNQVSSDHTAFVARLAEISGAEESTVALEEFARDAIQKIAILTKQYAAVGKRSDRLSALRVQLVAEKNILSYMINTYQTKYQLDILASSSGKPRSAKVRLRIVVLALVAGIRVAKGIEKETVSDTAHEIDVSGRYHVPGLALVARRRNSGVPLMNATIAMTAVPRLEEALKERELEIERLSSALGALDMSAVPALPEDIRNGIHSSFVYDADVVSRKEDLHRRLRKALKDLTDLEVRVSHEREKRMAAEAKVSKYCDKLVVTKRKLNKATTHAESKERTYKAAIKFLKQKADRAVEGDRDIDENTDPWAAQTPPKKGPDSRTQFNTSSQAADSLTWDLLQEQLARTERKLRGMEEGSNEYQQAMKFKEGILHVIDRMKYNRRAQSRGPTAVDKSVATGI